MAEEPHPLGEEPLPVDQHVVHVDVVVGDVDLGLGGGLRDLLVHARRHAPREATGEPCLGPLPARPAVAVAQALLERGEGEVEQRHEGQLRVEEVVDEVGAGVEGLQELIDGLHGALVQHRPARQGPVLLHEAALERLERLLEAGEDGVELPRVGGELGLEEGGERLAVAVGRAPGGDDLGDATLDASPLRRAVLRDERARRLGGGLGEGGVGGSHGGGRGGEENGAGEGRNHARASLVAASRRRRLDAR